MSNYVGSVQMNQIDLPMESREESHKSLKGTRQPIFNHLADKKPITILFQSARMGSTITMSASGSDNYLINDKSVYFLSYIAMHTLPVSRIIV